jgi:hypothetical protein
MRVKLIPPWIAISLEVDLPSPAPHRGDWIQPRGAAPGAYFVVTSVDATTDPIECTIGPREFDPTEPPLTEGQWGYFGMQRTL